MLGGGMIDESQITDLLEQAKNKAIGENIAQAIYYDLRELENRREVHEKRWCWELLQNALDAADQEKGIEAEIAFSNNELIFKHNGRPFSPNEISHLVYQGTTKFDDQTKRGKFGRGFLVTHLLSPKVHIEGLVDISGTTYMFQMDINRTGDIPKLNELMTESWKQFNNSLSESEGFSGYTTSYTYQIDENSSEVVEKGLQNIRLCIPFVLTFISELQKVTLSYKGTELSWQRITTETPVHDDLEMYVTEVECIEKQFGQKSISRITEKKYNIGGKGEVSLALLSTGDELTEISCLGNIPRFFAEGFPVSATDDFNFPFVIHSRSFELNPDRTELYLVGDGAETKTNWALLEKLPNNAVTLITHAVNQNWSNPHLVARVDSCKDKDWIDYGKFNHDILLPIVEKLLYTDINLVETAFGGGRVSPNSACVPINDVDERLFELLTKCKEYRGTIVDKSLIQEWDAILTAWAELMDCNKEDLKPAIPIASVSELIESSGSIEVLHNELELMSGETDIGWLSTYVQMLLNSQDEILISNTKLLPDQVGIFHRISELSLDGDIDDDLKNIAHDYDINVRSDLISNEFEFLRDRMPVKTERSVVLEVSVKNNKEMRPDVNARLLSWFIKKREYHDQLEGFPVTTNGEVQELSYKNPLIKPISLWPENSQAFYDLFPQDFILSNIYQGTLTDEEWLLLVEKGLVYASLFYNEEENNLENVMLVFPMGEDLESLDHTIRTQVSHLCYSRTKDKGLFETVRKSREKGGALLRFLLDFLLIADNSWENNIQVECSCGEKHAIYPCGWLRLLKDRSWVRIAKDKGEKPSAENLSNLIAPDLLDRIIQDERITGFFQKLGIGVSELVRIKIADPQERVSADRIAAMMYAQSSQTRELIQQVINDPKIQELAGEHIRQKAINKKNRQIGSLIEDLLKSALEKEHVTVNRTGRGSDYDIEYDFVVDGEEYFFEVGKYLLEVKSTRTDDVRMTLTQASLAANLTEDYAGYILGVCPLQQSEINEETVRNNIRFVFDIGEEVSSVIEQADQLLDFEKFVKTNTTGDVELEITENTKRIKIHKTIWEGGVDFQNAIERLKGIG